MIPFTYLNAPYVKEKPQVCTEDERLLIPGYSIALDSAELSLFLRFLDIYGFSHGNASQQFTHTKVKKYLEAARRQERQFYGGGGPIGQLGFDIQDRHDALDINAPASTQKKD